MPEITGDRNISAGGDIKENTIVTGDGNTIIFQQGADADAVINALRSGGLLPTLITRLPETSFHQLLGLLQTVQLPDEELWFRLYRDCLPKGVQIVNSTIPALLLTDLCMHAISKRWPPILEFVERLVLSNAAKQHSPVLQSWVDENASLLLPPVLANDVSLLRQELKAAQKKQTALAETSSYLMLYLEPDLHNRTQERKQPLFRVEFVLWSEKTNGPRVIWMGDEKVGDNQTQALYTLDQLPTLLDQAFANKEVVALIPNMNQLLIEIVAPSNALCAGFEHWKRNNNAKMTYGLQHQIVVRLQDRLTIPNPADQEIANGYWQQKWQSFKQTVAENEWETIPWLDHDKLEDSFVTLIDLQNQAEVACLGVDIPIVREKQELFELLRDAGIPIALWMRAEDAQSPAATHPKVEIETLFAGRKLAELPKAMYEIRRSAKALKESTFVGNQLTLLWDDFDRPAYKYSEKGALQ